MGVILVGHPYQWASHHVVGSSATIDRHESRSRGVGGSVMSLMQRVERAQQGADKQGGALIPVIAPPAPPPTTRTPERDPLLREVQLRLQEEIRGRFPCLVDATPEEAHTK